VIALVRRALRRRVPAPIRLRIALARRALHDSLSGTSRAMVRPSDARVDGSCATEILSVIQPVRQSEHWQGKLANLRLAAARLNGAIIAPGRIFSFWALIGPPDVAHGFQIGRSIRADVLGPDIGGGLCQLSGLAYELGLRAGLAIIERHPHTQDLYTEATRFTPLGLDATVVYGHKDVRLENDRGTSIEFHFAVETERVIGTVRAATALAPAMLEIDKVEDGAARHVRVFRTSPAGVRELMSADVYTAHAPADPH